MQHNTEEMNTVVCHKKNQCTWTLFYSSVQNGGKNIYFLVK